MNTDYYRRIYNKSQRRVHAVLRMALNEIDRLQRKEEIMKHALNQLSQMQKPKFMRKAA